MTLDEASSLTDVAFAVCTALHHAGIEAVLTGGSAAAFYAPAVLQSYDADFILKYGARSRDVRDALASLGFRSRASGDFAHPNVPYTVEFPAGPLAVGSDLITLWSTERRGDELLHVLTPTDVVRDRFLHFFAWPDVSAYAAAITVGKAMRQRVDWALFERWARREAADDRTYDVSRLDRYLREMGLH